MKAVAKKYISPLILEGTIMIKRGKYGVSIDFEKKAKVTIEQSDNKTLKTPNFYPWEQIEAMTDYFKIIDEST